MRDSFGPLPQFPEQDGAARGCDTAGDHHRPAALDQNDIPSKQRREQPTEDHRNSEGQKSDDHAVSIIRKPKIIKAKLCFYRQKTTAWEA